MTGMPFAAGDIVSEGKGRHRQTWVSLLHSAH